ncbi:MAG: hypothetical protein JRI34_05350 [Deltaproteobacteria bacterium]|nr:hypothetical protein [Deltaproteobacteria bacterium]
MKRIALAALIIAAIAVAGFACGVKAPPQPAHYFLPGRVSPLKYHFNEDGLLVISFKAPVKNLLGKPPINLGGFFLDRSENRLDPGFCPGCPVTYTQRIRIEAKRPTDYDEIWPGLYIFKDRLTPGHVYHYRIFAHDRKGRYSKTESQNLVLYYDSPSRPPDAVTVKTDDRLVTLTWPPPDRLVDGRPLKDLAGYNLYRRTDQSAWEKINTDQPLNRTMFEDRQVQNGQKYYYKIRALRQWHGTLIEGASTPVVTAVPEDLTPPPPPVKLEGASVRDGISLRWQDVEAADLAGYRIYRRVQNEDRFQRLPVPLVREAAFLDQTVKPGRRYFYRVTAVDSSRAANESEPGQELAITFNP